MRILCRRKSYYHVDYANCRCSIMKHYSEVVKCVWRAQNRFESNRRWMNIFFSF